MVIPLLFEQIAIQKQLLVSNIQVRARFLFGKDAFVTIDCWKDYTNRLVHVKQMTIPLILQKKLQYHQVPQHRLHYNLDAHLHHFKQ